MSKTENAPSEQFPIRAITAHLFLSRFMLKTATKARILEPRARSFWPRPQPMQQCPKRIRVLTCTASPLLLGLLLAGCSSDGPSAGAGGASASAGAGPASGAAGAAAAGSGGAAGAGVGAGAGGSLSNLGGSANDAGSGGSTPSGGSGGGPEGGGPEGGGPEGGGAGASATCPKPAGQICHEFLANDNSKNQLHYVNEFEPAKSWTVKVNDTGNNSARDIQLVENAKSSAKLAVLVSVDKGFVEYDVVGGAQLNRVGGFSSVTSALRVPSDATTKLPAGTTILARDLATSELDYVDAAGKQVAPAVKLTFAGGSEIRKLERNPQNGNLTFTKYESDAAAYVYEITEQGAQLGKLQLPAGSKGYNAVWRSGGGFLAASGSPCTVLTLSAEGAVLGTVGGKGKFKDASGTVIFSDVFSGVQLLANGNVVVANWLGHVTPADHPSTPELLEISPSNQLVWSWGNQATATWITNGYVVR